MVLHSPLIALIIMVVIFGSAMIGMLMSRVLPEAHLSAETKAVVTASMAVVGTMSALVIGLLVSTANTSFTARNANVADLSIDIVKMDNILHRYGPAADPIRQDLKTYAAMTMGDLFAKQRRNRTVENAATNDVLSQIQDSVIALKPTDARQTWLAAQALQASTDISSARWLLVAEEMSAFQAPFLGAVLLWLIVLFLSYGLFAPRNLTAIIAMALCAFAVAAALKLMLDMEAPFEGGITLSSPPIRLSADPLQHALDLLGK
ncbi:bestrophin-like domain [Acidisoma silvae]|uniref:DUF4239 domain-containing protein n=1 Tax=Acidisoma silvae TaxID=2802396 RepID=A0A963YWD7_9PROT|nr:hypothetical protein [Acidisoma silvae]MCB8877587.1 hypothetical protein [Acidisoma silvae]